MTDGNSTNRNSEEPCGQEPEKNEDCRLSAEEERARLEQFRQKMDGLYPKINAILAPLRIKKDLDYTYSRANFKEAMDFTLMCNALSLIRSVYQGSELSATTALTARDAIEALVLLKMQEEGVFTEEDEKLFLWQYALIEYDTYYKDGEKFASLLNLKELTARYEKAQKIYNDAGVSGGVEQGKIRQAVRSRVPFMCKHTVRGRRIDFNTLLQKHLPSLLPHYDLLSYYAHPNVNARMNSRYGYYKALEAVIDAISERYGNYKPVGFYIQGAPLSVILDKACNPETAEETTDRLRQLMIKQANILNGLSEDFKALHSAVFEELTELKYFRSEDNYLTRFFCCLPVMLYDITYDYLLKLKECVKIKFKAVAEIFAHFDRVIRETINAKVPRYGVIMLKFYEMALVFRRAGKTIPDELPPQMALEICENYRENYPGNAIYRNSKKSEEKCNKQVLQSFCQPLGNFLDEEGHVVSRTDLVYDFFKRAYGEDPSFDEMRKKNPLLPQVAGDDLMTMYYRESNNMSHGCGYLYFANYGALRDDGPIMQALDTMICGSVITVINEIERWQKLNGKEEHYAINEFLKNLKAAAEGLTFIALQKSLLYSVRGQ